MKGKNTYEYKQTPDSSFLCLIFSFCCICKQRLFPQKWVRCKECSQKWTGSVKNLDSETTQKYIPYTELFPDATENTDLTDEINETFSLFFRKFNYKISDVIVGTANHSATVSVKLTTINSKVLARDFKAELLRTQITESAQAQKEISKILPDLLRLIIWFWIIF